MTALRIHFLTQYVAQAGTYFRFHNLAVGLNKLGQQVTVFGCDPNPGSRERVEVREGVTYHITHGYKGMSLFGGECHPLTTIKRSIFNYPACDVAHLFQPFPSAAYPWTWTLRKKTKAMFYDWDDLWVGGLIKGRTKSFREMWVKASIGYLEKRLPKASHHVTTCSQFLAELATERKARSVSIIPNGFWPFVVPDKAVARMSLGLDPHAVYVGFMGRTIDELSWCFEALEMNARRHAQLRFALCGPTSETLNGLSSGILKRIDFLGSLPPLKTREFAAAIDLGLLPLEDNPFNQSRFPIKYTEYMSAGTPVLCSEVGECGKLSDNLSWIIKAGKTKPQWLETFEQAVSMLMEGGIAQVDIGAVEQSLSWDSISNKLLNVYLSEL